MAQPRPEKIRIEFDVDYVEPIALVLEGVADFNGRPHYLWYVAPQQGPDESVYALAPVDDSFIRMMSEYIEIWDSWNRAYYGGQVDISSHPIRDGNNPRYARLHKEMREIGEQLRPQAFVVVGRLIDDDDLPPYEWRPTGKMIAWVSSQ